MEVGSREGNTLQFLFSFSARPSLSVPLRFLSFFPGLPLGEDFLTHDLMLFRSTPFHKKHKKSHPHTPILLANDGQYISNGRPFNSSALALITKSGTKEAFGGRSRSGSPVTMPPQVSSEYRIIGKKRSGNKRGQSDRNGRQHFASKHFTIWKPYLDRLEKKTTYKTTFDKMFIKLKGAQKNRHFSKFKDNTKNSSKKVSSFYMVCVASHASSSCGK